MRPGRRSGTRPRPLTRWEIVGAWTHLWTPPRDAAIPPIPWRSLAIGALAAAAVTAVALALIIPPLEEGKRRGAAREARERAAFVAAAEKRLRADQMIQRASPGVAGAALVDALERSITADANARTRAGKLDGPILGTKCEPAGKAAVIKPGTRVYRCVAATSSSRPAQLGVSISTGYPFVATIDHRKGTIAWCKTNPQPGEHHQTGIPHVDVSPACAGKLSEVL